MHGLYGNFSCYTFADLLVNLTDNTTIYITTDMVLSSVTQLTHLKNIAIIGYNNPTVQCGYSGGLHFVSCHNVTIEGIIWNGYDANVNTSTIPEARLYMHNASNISLQNCTFQNSLGQSIVALSETSGNANISNCKFSHNNHHGNHGAAVHCYSSNDFAQLLLTISDCTFNYNDGTSIVYFYHSGTSQEYLSLENSTFNNNQGVSVYIVNQQLFISGLVLFEENNATCGSGLFVDDHASVIFTKTSITKFRNNIGRNDGGAIFLSNYSMISFDHDSIVVFNSNIAARRGALFLKITSVVITRGNSEIIFSGNLADFGEAVFSSSQSCLLIVETSKATFTENTAVIGGAVHLHNNSSIIFDDNIVVVFINNSATSHSEVVRSKYNNGIDYLQAFGDKECGGVLAIGINSSYTTKGNSTVKFYNNNAKLGGAICCDTNCNIAFKQNSSLKFHENSATGGGVAYCKSHAVLVVEGDSNIVFTNNKAYHYDGDFTKYDDGVPDLGGALIFISFSVFKLDENSMVTFSSNSAKEGGAMILIDNCTILLKGNTSVMFCNNNAVSLGGAVAIYSNSVFTVDENCTLKFDGNNANAGQAGAIGLIYSTVTIKGGTKVALGNNRADGGGAMGCGSNSILFVGGSSSLTFYSNIV